MDDQENEIAALKIKCAYFDAFLVRVGGTLQPNGGVDLTSEGYGQWTRRKGDARTKEIVAENDRLHLENDQLREQLYKDEKVGLSELTEKCASLVADLDTAKQLLQEFADFDIREQDSWASPCAYCRMNNRGEDWDEPHADDCPITKAQAIAAKQ